MFIYLQKSQKNNPISKHMISQFPDSQILEIDHYKNIFDKNIIANPQKSFVIGEVNNAILEAPKGYGHAGNWYFFKNSLNCIYDCSYCYLKGAFKNDIQVYFVNYEDIKKQIDEKIDEIRKTSSQPIWFYSSDYSDNLATDHLTQFCENFIPFFSWKENVFMEIRTKTLNIKPLLALPPTPNVEIAFSLNPDEVIKKYEHKTPALDLRIAAINKLIDAGWKVGIRFIPLLEIENYKEIYSDFLKYVTQKIDFTRVSSVFMWGLLFTQKDYNTMLKKEPHFDLLYKLKNANDGFYREDEEVRDWFYALFDELLQEQKCNRCLEIDEKMT